MIKVLFFARIRDQLGVAELELALPDQVDNIGRFSDWLIMNNPSFESVLRQPNTLVAVNQEFASPETTLEDGDEIAYFPPVTGG